MADVDQTVVDQILAKATEDTEEGRLEKLEREVETLKGSIKRLLLDIRETMNKLENPFVNLQSLAEANIVPQSAPQIQIVPTNIPECKTEKEEKKEEKLQNLAEETEKIEDRRSEVEKFEKKGEERMKAMFEAPVKPLIEKREAKIENLGVFDEKKELEFMTLFNLMEWVHSIVSRHSYETFKLLLEVFEMTGYINSRIKELMIKLADLVKVNGSKEVLIELYRLNRVLNPNDHSLDSDLLAFLLEKR
ncbi:MAG: hypothetical protein RMH75_04465 [Archaeoglobaceae archaeon]|nr:hypothetical protein [Archaeoglobaceae archaeon]MDW7989901.1 hypothetical protein [Archaeoglobaceae archaeon]